MAYYWGLPPATLPRAGEASLSPDEAMRVSSNIAKLLEFLKG